jgi:hypothetical protein
MSTLINASIDLTKIDKTKIQTHDKFGQPFKNGAKYLSVQIWVNDEPDQYGNNVSISVSQSLVEREAGEKKVYLGNGKINQPPLTPVRKEPNTGYPAAPTATSFELDESGLPY